MRDQEIDFACLVEEGDVLRPLKIRYGVTANEASHHEPLDLSLSQEEADLTVSDGGTWDELDLDAPAVPSTHLRGTPDDLDEEQVSAPAEQVAMHSI